MDKITALDLFHPVIKEWFLGNIGVPSPPQYEGWPKIEQGKNVLISAPTGTGKTLAAFLESINRLYVMGINDELPEGVFILYVSPLKALNNDIYKNLDIPFKGIKDLCLEKGLPFPDIKKAVRTGDTPQNERQKMIKNPPHILITTPESLFLMLTSVKANTFLGNIKYVIIDEIHTMLGTKRGVHLALSIERLEHISKQSIIRIGLSATVHPIELAGHYLAGGRYADEKWEERPVEIINPHMDRIKDLKIHLPVKDYRVLEQGSVWPEIYESIVELMKGHQSIIVFVNNRATAEKVAAGVNIILDEDICRPHHGSMSKNKRLEIEELFKEGELKCIVATSTLELGIDIGSVDMMIQISSPYSVSSGLQRLGRAGHNISSVSKGRIIPKTRGDLLLSAFISKEILDGGIEKEKIPYNCLDILSQQIVSMSCTGTWREQEILEVVRGAYSYRYLKEEEFMKVLSMLAGDYEHREDIPVKPRIIWDRINGTIEGNGYSRMLAVGSGGTIPDRGYFPIYLEDYKTRIGELDEEFVFEARIGERFMLGNSAWKITRIEKNRVIVAPTSPIGAKTPFWKGDGIGNPYEQAVKYGSFIRQLTEDIKNEAAFDKWEKDLNTLDETGIINIKNYMEDQIEAVGCVANDKLILVEYLSENEADHKIIIHSCFGGKVNSGLALILEYVLNKTIGCQVFASYTNDMILIHLYGCPDEISGIMRYVSEEDVERVIVSMLPKTSRFALAFRYNAYRALVMGIRSQGKRIPLWVQRLRSVDALETAGKYMDHPLIIETLRDCMENVFDIPNTKLVLRKIRNREIEVVEKNTFFPSPFTHEIMFGFQGIMLYQEKSPHPGDAGKPVISGLEALGLPYGGGEAHEMLGRKALEAVISKNNACFKLSYVSSGKELHSFLLIYGDITEQELKLSSIPMDWITDSNENNQILELKTQAGKIKKWIACEEEALYSLAEDISYDNEARNKLISSIDAPSYLPAIEAWTHEGAVMSIIKRFSRYHSPFDIRAVIIRYNISEKGIVNAINELISKGYLIQGYFEGEEGEKYCHSTIYNRIKNKGMQIAVEEIKPEDPEVLASYVPLWQGIGMEASNSEEEILYNVICMMEGLFLPSHWWENIIFPMRIKGYSPALLDRLTNSGRVVWRMKANDSNTIRLGWYPAEGNKIDYEKVCFDNTGLSGEEKEIIRLLERKGAAFTHVLTSQLKISGSELLSIMEGLIKKGIIVNDSFQAIRIFQVSGRKKGRKIKMSPRQTAMMISRMEFGRWEIAYPVILSGIEKQIDIWLRRYGMISKEIAACDETQYSWPQIYESLKKREYAGLLARGYFINGISGIQFMMPDAAKKLKRSDDKYIVINSCDPAQVYGMILPYKICPMQFQRLESTAVILKGGNLIAVFERYGERITIDDTVEEDIIAAFSEFKASFSERRLWPNRKKITVKDWPENQDDKQKLITILRNVGFEREVNKMVLFRG